MNAFGVTASLEQTQHAFDAAVIGDMEGKLSAKHVTRFFVDKNIVGEHLPLHGRLSATEGLAELLHRVAPATHSADEHSRFRVLDADTGPRLFVREPLRDHGVAT